MTLISFQSSMEDAVKELEKKWAKVQENALKQPSPGMVSYHISNSIQIGSMSVLDGVYMALSSSTTMASYCCVVFPNFLPSIC